MEQPQSENALIKERKEKLARLAAKGVNPFANKFTPTLGCGEARAKYVAGELKEGDHVEIAGRITAHRDMGKSQFMDLKDVSGRIQIYAQKQTLGDEQFDIFKHLDLGDFIGAKGELFTTKAGEPSVKITSFVILAKALRPPPAKWHGLEDTEIRYRQRYLDLMANDEVKDVFLKRAAIVREIRNFMHARGYVEVETPMMQSIPGGAAAQPFITKHNALGCQLYLRIALELYHKRLLVGGIDRVFEIGRIFRNEGLSRRHNPEFTMMEAYQAFGDYETMMELLEGMITHVAQSVCGSLRIEKGSARVSRAESGVSPDSSSTGLGAHEQENFRRDAENNTRDACAPQHVIDLTRPWKRVRYKDLVKEKAGADWFDVSPAERRRRAIEDLKLGGDIAAGYEDFEVTSAVFEKLIEPTLIQPTFVTHLPKELVPLAKLSPDDPTTVEVFELCINGQEIAPGYTEQNNPIEQRERLEHQAGGEQQKLDEDFLVALEHGMPPAGGIGIGIDRLCMMLLGQESIRDVILFPQLKPK
jgi:lysyl-tRNA synthetase class 2